jgi:hypothetical protein
MNDIDGKCFYGKYRGTVVVNIDPLGLGRLLVTLPDVLGLPPSSWCIPCVPLAGPPAVPMGVHFLPPIGAGVWVEFEQGDPDHPIWVGCLWGENPASLPTIVHAGVPASPSIVLQTLGQNVICISDLPGPAGGILLRCGGSTVSITQTGVSIIAPKIELTAATINLTGVTDVNKGALKVT